MERTKKERTYSFLLAIVILATSLLSNAVVVLAKDPGNFKHRISIEKTEHGALVLKDDIHTIDAGMVVRLIAEADEGWRLKEIQVNAGAVPVEQLSGAEDEFQFVMPDEDVFIKADFIPEAAEETEKEESAPGEKITGVYFEFQTMEEILELAERGLNLQEFFQYSIWGFLDIDDIRYLVENGITFDDLYAAIEGDSTYYNSEEILAMTEA